MIADCELRGRPAADPGGHEVAAPYGLVLHGGDGLIRRLEIYEHGQEALAESGLAAG